MLPFGSEMPTFSWIYGFPDIDTIYQPPLQLGMVLSPSLGQRSIMICATSRLHSLKESSLPFSFTLSPHGLGCQKARSFPVGKENTLRKGTVIRMAPINLIQKREKQSGCLDVLTEKNPALKEIKELDLLITDI